MGIGYFERRKREAEEILKKLRDFYSSENPFQGCNDWKVEAYDYGVKSLVNFRVLDKSKHEENPIKSLRRIKRSIEYRSMGNHPFKRILLEVEKYANIPEEKRERARERNARPGKLSLGLKKWVEDATPLLEDILLTNTRKMDKMSYDYYTCHYRIKSEDGVFKISRWVSEGTYYENSPRKESEVAFEILGDIARGGSYEENHLRNRLVREIEKRTGRNLKKEVYEARQATK